MKRNLNIEQIPKEMKQCKNWVCWHWEERNGKKTKIPYFPETGRPAKSNDPNTWTTYENAITCKNRYSGIGFMLGSSPFVGIDIDHCIHDGKADSEAQIIIDNLDSYTEYSPSGAGIHIIVKADIGEKGRRKGPLEIYPQGRYFTVTGDVYQGRKTINIRDHELKSLISSLDQEEPDLPDKKDTSPIVDITERVLQAANAPLDIMDIIQAIKRSRQGPLFTKLFDYGDTSNYTSPSEADIALMNILPFWTRGDRNKTLQIFNMSALAQRDKWKTRPDYQEKTLEKAFKTWNGKVYDPVSIKVQKNNQDRFIKECGCTKTPNELKELAYKELSDTGNAERLELVYGEDLLYCLDSERWYKWDGKRWKPTSEKATELYNMVSSVMRLSSMAYTDAYGHPKDKEEEAAEQAFKRFCRKSENTRAIVSTLQRSRALFPVHMDDLNNNQWLLNCQNGTFNLKTGDFKEHSRADHITMVCNADYIPGLICSSLWERTITQIIPDPEVRRFLQKFIGYSLTGSTREEKFLFLHGPGGGGKGTFIETIVKILGDYADTIPVDILLSARNDAGSGNEPTPQLAKLVGKRLVTTSESGQGRKFNDAKVKLITGGDSITARLLRCNPVTFIPHFKIVMSSNFQPAVTNAMDEGMKRRMIIVPFNANIKSIRDNELKEKLLSPQERDGILQWCIEGCRLWQEEGLDDVPKAIEETTKGYYEANDIVGEFINTCCDVGPGKRIRSKILLESFNREMNDGRGWRDMRQKTFDETMTLKGFHKKRFNDGMNFVGINVKRYIP